jgi:hypothetical protein
VVEEHALGLRTTSVTQRQHALDVFVYRHL